MIKVNAIAWLGWSFAISNGNCVISELAIVVLSTLFVNYVSIINGPAALLRESIWPLALPLIEATQWHSSCLRLVVYDFIDEAKKRK